MDSEARMHNICSHGDYLVSTHIRVTGNILNQWAIISTQLDKKSVQEEAPRVSQD